MSGVLPDREWWRFDDEIPAAANRPKTIQAHDNDAERKPLIYGPKGEVLVRQEPRPVGFRKR